MMATKIKLCGLRSLEDARLANEVKPDFAGVVLCRRFWRGIDFELASAIRRTLSSNIPLVGVFVNDEFSTVHAALRRGVVDMVQLEGTESETYIRDLMLFTGKEVIKGCNVTGPDVPSKVEHTAANYLLFSSENDKPFEWDWVAQVQRPFILSGGLTVENLPQALRRLHPWGVDLSAGVETDCVKDPEKVRAAVELVRTMG
jgi:phosphoribosylanthranilate isomerase